MLQKIYLDFYEMLSFIYQKNVEFKTNVPDHQTQDVVTVQRQL